MGMEDHQNRSAFAIVERTVPVKMKIQGICFIGNDFLGNSLQGSMIRGCSKSRNLNLIENKSTLTSNRSNILVATNRR